MPNAQKTERVTALKEQIEGSDALLLAEYRGLSVHDATELRRSLAEQARFSVVKNTLFQRAATSAGIQDLKSLLSGPTAVAFVHGDVVSVAKKVVDAGKRHPALVIKGAFLDGQVLDAAAAQALATLESREAMLSRIAGLLGSEMSRAARMFQALQSRFVGLLEAYRDTLPAEASAAEGEETPAAQGEVAEAPAAAEAEDEATADAAPDQEAGPADTTTDENDETAEQEG
jgi:large subunit ribosomal protein L10